MNNEDFRNDQREFDESAFYASSAPSSEDISGVVENLSKPRSMLYSVISLVCGIVSVVIGCCGGWFGLGIGALALAFSIVARRHLGYFDGKAIAGLVRGICGALFGVATIFFSYLINSGALDAFLDEIIREMEGDLGTSLPGDAF
jgi:Mg2+/citrate symporter